jgi:H+/Cl- antiporter ClcA
LLHTPFGAAVFALEVCYMGAIVYEDFVPVLLSSISAYIMTARIARVLPFGDLLQQAHLFRTVVHETAFPWSLDYLAYCIIVALFTTLLVIVFIKAFLFIQESSGRIFKGRYRPVVGTILVALVAFVFFRKRLGDVLGELSDLVEVCGTAWRSIDAPIVLLVGRSATTFFTVGFGGSGGLFAPTVLLGSLSGITVARLLGIDNVTILLTTGISAALVGVMNVPMAAVIMAVEIFGVSFIIPAAIGSTIAFLLAKNWVIYPNIQRYREPD